MLWQTAIDIVKLSNVTNVSPSFVIVPVEHTKQSRSVYVTSTFVPLGAHMTTCSQREMLKGRLVNVVSVKFPFPAGTVKQIVTVKCFCKVSCCKHTDVPSI